MKALSVSNACAVATVWLSLALGGCGDDVQTPADAPAAQANGQAEPPEGAVDVCSIMPAEEVQAIVGHPLSAEDTSYTYVTTEAKCRYRSTEMDLQAVEIRIESLANPEVQSARVRDILEGGKNPVSGIGEEAFLTMMQLFVFTGKHQVVVMVGGLPGVDREAARRQLAETVISRL